MQIKRDENIRLADGRSATLSTVLLPDGWYETMLFTNDPAMEEITTTAIPARTRRCTGSIKSAGCTIPPS